jgi:diaminopimelate decarboxylase
VPFGLENDPFRHIIPSATAFTSEDLMDYFHYRDGRLFAEEVDVAEVASAVGTPLYVYSKRTILHHLERLREAFAVLSPLVCYSIKANASLEILRICAAEGAGFDIVSGGELFCAEKAGADMRKVVYSGVGKTREEIGYALDSGILFFNVESRPELAAIDEIAAAKSVTADVSLRVNPDVDAGTHAHITTGRKENKFGIVIDDAVEIAESWRNYPNCRLVGLDMHLGSQITEPGPSGEALDKLLVLVDRLRALGHDVRYIDAGGGFGINYYDDEAASADEMAAVFIERLSGSDLKLVIEPGRFVVGNACVLVTGVTYVKNQSGKRFVITDAAMTELVRPALYGAYHRIWPAATHLPFSPDESVDTPLADVVGPVCESTDFLAKERPLPEVGEGDLLAVFGAGAYGMSMASNYNARCRAAEVMVDGDSFKIVRRRETYEDLVDCEV